MSPWRRFLHEPLVHFLLLGGALFFWFEWRGARPGAERIVLTSGQIDHLATGFARTWQRSPTEAELKALTDEWIREEIATREAIALGLDRDDTVIRRRLRQKLEFLIEDADTAPPGVDDLQAWLDDHPDAYRIAPCVAFRQVILRPDRRGESVEDDALRVLEALRAAGAEARLEAFGDPSMLPAEIELESLDLVARDFGPEFASTLATAEIGRWTGPVRSGYGLHLVLVREMFEGRLPELDEVRAQVERDIVADRRRTRVAETYDRWLKRYTVVIDSGSDAAASTGAR